MGLIPADRRQTKLDDEQLLVSVVRLQLKLKFHRCNYNLPHNKRMQTDHQKAAPFCDR